MSAIGNVYGSVNVSAASTATLLSDREIESIAKDLTSAIMNELGIDKVYERSDVHSFLEHLFPKFDPDSKMFKTILSIVSDRITEALSRPFIKKGLVLNLFEENNSGLLDQISEDSLKPILAEAKKNLINNRGLQKLEMTIVLFIKRSANTYRTENMYTEIGLYINDDQVHFTSAKVAVSVFPRSTQASTEMP